MEKLKIAIQKSGRLHDDSVEMLKQCGMSFSAVGNKLIASVSNFPLEILFLRDDDIPQYVQDGVADIGILGENVVVEKSKQVEITERLGFGKCRLSIAVPRAAEFGGISFLEGKRIATSYPKLLTQFLQKHKVNATIEEISGSVEIATGIGLADAVCDIVSSGSTLLTNGLKEAELVFNSEAVLISGSLTTSKKDILEKLLFRIRAVNKAKKFKYVLLNIPTNKIEAVKNVLPGMKSPTILPLALEGWSSLHSVISEDDFWTVIDKLKDVGAEGILIVPIEKMVL
ncbi:MAG TPA: ATP phosphoribosyltransferase [Flavobacteriales bacterium]|nr:ATP phosphoribosyltransferase [Flavobacteriales bacterium]